jgi:hypothetical protein
MLIIQIIVCAIMFSAGVAAVCYPYRKGFIEACTIVVVGSTILNINLTVGLIFWFLYLVGMMFPGLVGIKWSIWHTKN